MQERSQSSDDAYRRHRRRLLARQSPRVRALIDPLGLESGPSVGDAPGRFIDQVWPAYRGLTRELGLAVE